MADNVAVTPGAGATIATDEVGGVHYQAVKLAHGGLDSATLVSTTSGLPVQQQGTWNIAAVTSITNVVQVGDNSGSLTVDAPVATPVFVRLSDGAAAISTLPISMAAALPAGTNAIGKLAANSGVDIGDVDVTSVPADPFGVNADAASATGSISAKLRFIASTGIPITGTVTVGSHAVTNAGTFAVQAAQSGTWNITNISGTVSLPTGASTLAEQQTQTTSLQLLDDTVTAQGTALGTTKTSLIGASVLTAAPTYTTGQISPLSLTTAGALRTDSSGTTQPVSGTVSITANSSVNVNQIGGNAVNAGTGAAGTGTQRVVTATDSTIGTVTSVTQNADVRQSTASNLNAQVVGAVVHDAADSGNPMKIGMKALSSLATVTLVAANDRTDSYADLDGAQLVRPGAPLGDLKSDATSNTDGASTASAVFTAVASTKNYVTAVHVFRSDAGTTPIFIDFRDGTGGAVLYRAALPPNGGAVLPSSAMPYFKTSANTALAYDVSAATTTVYINVSGFQSKL